MVLAHGMLVRFKTSFAEVVRALEEVDEASNIFLEVLSSSPKIAVALGEKAFLRTGRHLTAFTTVVGKGSETLVRVIAAGSRASFLALVDYNASRDYVYIVLRELSKRLKTTYEVVSEVRFLKKDLSEELRFKL